MQNRTVGDVASIECQVGKVPNGDDCKIPRLQLLKSEADGKTKRKARSTRRRLNAMMSNASLHFSDTDSEGELQVPRSSTPSKRSGGQLLHPTISVTPDAGGDDTSYASGGRRGSFVDNLTDVDEIYASEPENGADQAGKRPAAASLSVTGHAGAQQQAETDFEEMSNDDIDEVPIYVEPRGDILVDFAGETITTKEGDGPFSVEIRNQMSVDDAADGRPSGNPGVAAGGAPEIAFETTTDSEDMEASDDDDGQLEATCGFREAVVEDLETLAASQIVMKNCSKMDQLLSVKEPDDALSDAGHTDVEELD